MATPVSTRTHRVLFPGCPRCRTVAVQAVTQFTTRLRVAHKSLGTVFFVPRTGDPEPVELTVAIAKAARDAGVDEVPTLKKLMYEAFARSAPAIFDGVQPGLARTIPRPTSQLFKVGDECNVTVRVNCIQFVTPNDPTEKPFVLPPFRVASYSCFHL